VLPIWERQAERGEALTITDVRCTRFWMSERDAVMTVLRASRLSAGECYIPKMQALNIADMARMLHPGALLVETGLRSLEKIHEDLVHPDEPAHEVDGGFVLSAAGTIGHAYSSDMAPRMGVDQLRYMMADA
jgi:FlaA1/EpsC-like NDP-sugar epimerase